MIELMNTFLKERVRSELFKNFNPNNYQIGLSFDQETNLAKISVTNYRTCNTFSFRMSKEEGRAIIAEATRLAKEDNISNQRAFLYTLQKKYQDEVKEILAENY